jgi:methyl-accepting chemotaxis protein
MDFHLFEVFFMLADVMLPKIQYRTLSMKNWWSKLPLKNKLQIPIQLLLFVVMLFAQRVVLDKFEERLLEESRQKAGVVADGVVNGLNMLMINGIISDADQRALYIKKMGASEGLLDLRIIRNKLVQDQYGEGLPSEQAIDAMDRAAMTSGNEQIQLTANDGTESLRVAKPFIAMRDFRGTDCLSCHTAPDNAVLGAVSVTLDVSGEFAEMHKIDMVLWGVQLVAQIFFYFMIGWLIRFVTRPLQDAVEAADAVAQGDLTRRVEVTSGDEIGRLMQALKHMNESLAGIVFDVRSNTDSISIAAQEIAAGNRDLSERTEGQAASLEETASSMGELTHTVHQNAENAKQANQLAAQASDIAVKGGRVVGDVVNTMASISASSKKIVDIISVIDGIAFQTNILALNAAVEAARAGEQGRGFAVVAGEVRSLAQRSAAAAKEIKELIGDSVGKVEAGAAQVEQAGMTMNEIVHAVKRVTDIMAEISMASSEQSAGIEQVNLAIAQMDDVTQQNAALVEEAAAAAESMQEQATVLKSAVSVFKLEGGAWQVAPTHHLAPIASPSIKRVSRSGNRENMLEDWKEF